MSADHPDLATLVALFYSDTAQLGQFELVTADEMPPDYCTLLAHQNHMTVTVERFHNSPVDVRVLKSQVTGTHYARKILLARQSDGVVVQFGIMRINFAYLSEKVRREVESRAKPLGRILIENNVLREVELVKLWKVTPGEDLRSLFSLPKGAVTYGRTALIHCNGEPAVELLEIVTPV
jgi:chorismate-pyruvate lyase